VFIINPYCAKSQKKAFFIVTGMKTSNTTFAIEISKSKGLGASTNGSAVPTSICLT
jgi:hypothetical protein